MAASTNKFAYDRNLYRNGYRVSGNLAVEEDEFDEIEELAPEKSVAAPSRRTRRDRGNGYEEQEVKAPRVKTRRYYNFDFVKFALFIACVGFLVYYSYGYLEVKSDITQMKKTIAAANTKLEAAKDRNNALSEALNVSYDLNKVYEIATEKLNMCYPSDNSVLTYELSNSGYVRQYDSIPGKK